MRIIQLSMFDGKACTQCKEWKLFDRYARHPKTLDRRASRCKDCEKLYRMSRGDLPAKATLVWREQNKNRFDQYNRDYVRIARQAYRARRRTAQGTVTRAEWRQLCEYYDYRCLCCGSRENLSMDHVIPLSKGGPHSIDNIQPLCRICNSSKNARHIDYRPTFVVK